MFPPEVRFCQVYGEAGECLLVPPKPTHASATCTSAGRGPVAWIVVLSDSRQDVALKAARGAICSLGCPGRRGDEADGEQFVHTPPVSERV